MPHLLPIGQCFLLLLLPAASLQVAALTLLGPQEDTPAAYFLQDSEPQDLAASSADRAQTLRQALGRIYEDLQSEEFGVSSREARDVEESKKIPPGYRRSSLGTMEKRDRCYCDLDLFCFGCRRRKRPDMRTLLAASMFRNSRSRRDSESTARLHEISLNPALYDDGARMDSVQSGRSKTPL